MTRRNFMTTLFGSAAAAVTWPAWLAKLIERPAAWVSYRFKYTVLPAPPRRNRVPTNKFSLAPGPPLKCTVSYPLDPRRFIPFTKENV